MRQESLFDPLARSVADARGLLQLLPATARRVANERADAAAVDLNDPEQNVSLGVRHLADLDAHFQGDMVKALAAYNGGAAAVERWQQRFAGRDADEFVESITYRETRDYVKRVLDNYARYRRLYSSDAG